MVNKLSTILNSWQYTMLLVFIFCQSLSYSQTVGLVLSGGGSKGAAHIGVLKALEENNIPIDFITGTSMGAVVGGLYAAGYSPEQMDSMIFSEEFLLAIEGQSFKQYEYYFLKPYPDAGWLKLHYNFDSRVQADLPGILRPTEQLDFLIMELFAAASAASNYNFDSLFVPFRCVASDINNNIPVVLNDGDLGTAVRASMSFPFYFKPVKLNDRIMMDGGMYNNFPSDVMYNDFLPDIIIGSKAASNYQTPREDDFISQIQSMMMENTEYSVLCDDGILIKPNLPSVNILDFSRTREMIDSGYAAAMRFIPQLSEMVTEYRTPENLNIKRQEFAQSKPELFFDSVKVTGMPENQEKYVKNWFKISNQPLGTEKVKSDYFKLISYEKISSITPKAILMPGKDHFCLCLNVLRKKDLMLTVGGNISSNPTNEAFIELNYSYLRKQALHFSANTYIGRFYSSIRLGSRIDFPGKTPFLFDLSFSWNQWDYFKTTTYFFEDKNPSYLIENENNMFINMIWPTAQNGKIELGYVNATQRFDYYQTNYFTREDTADRTKFGLQAGHLLIEYNTLNYKQYPDKGMLFRSYVRYLWGKETNIPGSTSFSKEEYSDYHNWFTFDLLYIDYILSTKHYSLGIDMRLHISNQSFFNNYTSSLLSSPDFSPIPESKTLFLSQFRAYNYGAVGLVNIVPLYKKIGLRLEGYLFQPFQEILETDTKSATLGEPFENRYYMTSAAVVYQSPIGPASLSFNYYSTASDPFTVVFNFGYVIFNRKARE